MVLMDCYCFYFSSMAMPKTLCYFPYQHIRLHRYLTNNKINTLKLLFLFFFFLHYGTLLTTSLVLKWSSEGDQTAWLAGKKKSNCFLQIISQAIIFKEQAIIAKE